MDRFKPHIKPIRLFFFWSGIIAALAYRAIIILNYYSPFWVKISWYIGTIGFIIYFWHRYTIQKKRSELVRDFDLLKLAREKNCGTNDQNEALIYIVRTTLTSKAKWNSLFIFWLSLIVLVIAIVMDSLGV